MPGLGFQTDQFETVSPEIGAQGRASDAHLTAQVGGLRVYDQSDRTDANPSYETPVDPSNALFRAVAAVIHLGLSLLETPRSRETLVQIGLGLIQERGNCNHVYEDRPENMMRWVELFLARMRGSFPTLILTNRIRGEGLMLRNDWASPGIKMRQYDPKDAGILKLNKLIMQNLLRAGDSVRNNESFSEAHFAAYESFTFIMAITVAHELVHFFIGYLTGRASPNTPEKISYLPSIYNKPGIDGKEIGESGRTWEGDVFGGIVETAEDSTDPLGAYQAGTLWLIDERKQVRRIDRSFVKRILNEDFVFPLQTTGPAISLTELDRNHRAMNSVREPLLSRSPAQIVSRERPSRTISNEDVERYILVASYSIRNREFTTLRQAIREPHFLFVSA
ncbi:hypothetical protein F5Y01DRAFT_316439 [Xylaria sp. FL0043]|nr:hypothetical protein F5Y01DRAFT_316439 [Xylaria sp. FL0043]